MRRLSLPSLQRLSCSPSGGPTEFVFRMPRPRSAKAESRQENVRKVCSCRLAVAQRFEVSDGIADGLVDKPEVWPKPILFRTSLPLTMEVWQFHDFRLLEKIQWQFRHANLVLGTGQEFLKSSPRARHFTAIFRAVLPDCAKVTTAITTSSIAPGRKGRRPCVLSSGKLVRSPTPAKVSRNAHFDRLTRLPSCPLLKAPHGASNETRRKPSTNFGESSPCSAATIAHPDAGCNTL